MTPGEDLRAALSGVLGEGDGASASVYDNPDEIQGDLSRARLAPIINTWGFTQLEGYRNESFVFIIDGDGRITSKYEGFATKRELEKGLEEVLD